MVQSDIFHGGPAPVEQGQIIAVLCVVLPRVDWVRELIYCRTKATFLMVHLPVDRPRATFLMVKRRRFPWFSGQKSDVFHSTKATTLMDSRASNGDIFHGPTAANLFNVPRGARPSRRFSSSKGGRFSIVLKPGAKKSSKRLTSASTQTLHPVSLVTNQIA